MDNESQSKTALAAKRLPNNTADHRSVLRDKVPCRDCTQGPSKGQIHFPALLDNIFITDDVTSENCKHARVVEAANCLVANQNLDVRLVGAQVVPATALRCHGSHTQYSV